MELHPHVDELRRQLSVAAEAGGPEAQDLARRLTAPLDAAAQLVLLTALSEAAGEISAELAPGSVEVRLRAGSPEFVVTPPPPTGPDPLAAPEPTPTPVASAETEGGRATRTTLRLPDHLKDRAEAAAAAEGVSVNTWLVRAVASALDQPSSRAAPHGAPSSSSGRLTGWVR